MSHPLQYAGARASLTSITPGTFGPDSIPLNLLALIISFLDNDPPSLAALCRTSRVLYYMTLPHLWASVSLRSHSSIRYKDDTLPEGFGSASPFSMGLNALVTHNVSDLVKQLTLEGDWVARDLQEYSRVGRVSEQSMILNIAVRAAVDRCHNLEAFRWDLDTKLQPNVYTGLAALKNLTRLHLRFPSSRAPQPTIEIPALPNLTSFTFTHYDPLCYPDDISRLLLHAKKLTELQLHFSPRMRNAGEPSVQLSHLFRKNVAARRKLKLQKLGLYNLFARAEAPEMMGAVDTRGIENFTSLNTFGRDEGSAGGATGTDFLDSTWLEDVDAEFPHMKAIRMDQLHKAHALGINKGLERLYLVNARHGTTGCVVSASPASTDSSPSLTNGSSNSNRLTPGTPAASSSNKLKEIYFSQICDHAGPTLKHLLFPARWGLTINEMARLIRSCPNLTQLSCCFDCTELEMLRMLVPFLTRLWAIRLVFSEQMKGCYENKLGKERVGKDELEQQREMMRKELASGDLKHLRYVGLGDSIWEIGAVEQVVGKVPVPVEAEQQDAQEEAGSPQFQEEIVFRRKVKRIRLEDVQGVEIWKCDTLDVV